MKVKGRVILITIICTVVLILLGYALNPYIDAYRANRHLDASGVRLLMAPSEVENILGKGSPIGGFGAEFYEYENSAVRIAFPTDGLLAGKAGWIEISEPGYGIYGVRPGDSVDKAALVLKEYGFTQGHTEKNFFKRGSTWVYVFEGSVRISIEDWTVKGRVY